MNVKFFDWDYLHLTALMKETYFSKVINRQYFHKKTGLTVKKIFRITDEFAHNYAIFVTILCPTLTKMDTLIIQNKLRILRNGFQNSCHFSQDHTLECGINIAVRLLIF